MNNLRKRNALNSLILTFNPSIILLQETNIDSTKKQDSLTFASYKTLYNNSTTHIGSGTIFLVKNHISVISDTILVPGKLHFMHTSLNNADFYLFNCHFPFETPTCLFFIQKIHDHILTLHDKSNIFIAGDFNFVHDKKLDRVASRGSRVSVAKAFEDNVLKIFDLVDSYRFINPKGKDMTFFSKLKNNSEARLDRVYCHRSKALKIKLTQMIPFISDHIVFNAIFTSDDTCDKRPLWVLPKYLLSNDNFLFSMKQLLDKYCEEEKCTHFDYSKLKQEISCVAMAMNG